MAAINNRVVLGSIAGSGSKEPDLNVNPAQEKKILEYMQAGNTLTPLEALYLFGCFRLGARVFELRKKYAIKTEMVIISPGKRVARYSLAEVE